MKRITDMFISNMHRLAGMKGLSSFHSSFSSSCPASYSSLRCLCRFQLRPLQQCFTEHCSFCSVLFIGMT